MGIYLRAGRKKLFNYALYGYGVVKVTFGRSEQTTRILIQQVMNVSY